MKKAWYFLSIGFRLSLKIALNACIFLLFSWSICFNFLVAYVWITLSLIICFIYGRGLFYTRTLILYLVVYLFFLPVTLHQYQTNTALMFQKTQRGEKLTTQEKLSIYGLNIIIASLAYPVYPEISKESFLMIFPTSGKNVRFFKSNFFLKSEKVQQAISSGASRVVWSAAKDYALGCKEARYALALNPCTLSVLNKKNKPIYMVTVPIKYPYRSNVTLLNYPVKVTLEEGLFACLQQDGWLHPYTAVWCSSE